MSSEERRPYLIYVELNEQYFMKVPELAKIIRNYGTKANQTENNIGLCGFGTERDLTDEEQNDLSGLLKKLRDEDKTLKDFKIKEKINIPNPN